MTQKLGQRRNPLTGFDRKIVVYLEGPSDHAILSRLLHELEGMENIAFKAEPGNDVIGKVEKNIGREEADGEIVFGIVDRDSLFKKADTLADFFEPEDAVFKRKRPMGPRIRVLPRWEIENYLILDPQAIATMLRDRDAPNAPIPSTATNNLEMLQCLLRLGDSQVPLIATCAHAVSLGQGHPFEHETWAMDQQARADTERKIEQEHGTDWRSYQARVEAMHSSPFPELIHHWQAMNRLVDGKRILRQLCKKKSMFGEFRATLASYQKTRSNVIRELVEILNEFQRESQLIARATA